MTVEALKFSCHLSRCFLLNVDKAAEFDTEEPKICRWRKMPRRFEEGVEDEYYHEMFNLTTCNAIMRLLMS
jgi:hypothetical protein